MTCSKSEQWLILILTCSNSAKGLCLARINTAVVNRAT